MSNLRFSPVYAVLTGWLLIGSLQVLRTPVGAFTHDFKDHLFYTRIVAGEKRLPLPREGWETYQPPLYYLINALIIPASPSHALAVRFLSILYGWMFLWIAHLFLTRQRVPEGDQWLPLSFIASTPAFVFLFTTYNNDALASVCTALAVLFAVQWLDQENRRDALGLFAAAAAGLYAKLSGVFALMSLGICLCIFGSRRLGVKTLLVLAGSVLLLAPWLLGHNYRHTGRLSPAPADFPLYEAIHLPHSWLLTVLTPPGLTPQEWRDPWAHQWEREGHKKNSYGAYLLSTSVFGEYSFSFLPSACFWAILAGHIGMIFLGVAVARRTIATRLAATMIVCGLLLFPLLILRAPYAGLMDFRYVAWLWLPAAVLWAESLRAESRRDWICAAARSIMTASVVLQALFLIVLWIASFRWYF